MNADGASSTARARAGGAVLSLLAGPLCAPILRAHLEGPLRLPDLRERLGGAAQTTLRGQVGNLRAIGALERHVRGSMPYTVENELTDAGRGILIVADTVEAWLSHAPQGPIAFGSEPAKGAIRALVAGWDSSILGILATGPVSLTALDGAIAGVSYPSLERRIAAMRAARQVEIASDGAGATKPYSVTEWTRRSVGLLVTAGRCEREHLAGAADPLSGSDIEVAFLLAVPLLELPAEAGGSCRLAVGDAHGDEPGGNSAGVDVRVERGEVVSCVSGREPEPAAWATGSVDGWVSAILDGRIESLDLSGEDAELARALVECMHASRI